MIRSYSILPSPPQEWFMVEDGVVSAGTLWTLEDLWLLSPLSSPRSQPLSPHQLWTSISLSPLTHRHHSSAQIVPKLSKCRDTCPVNEPGTRHPSISEAYQGPEYRNINPIPPPQTQEHKHQPLIESTILGSGFRSPIQRLFLDKLWCVKEN